MRLRSPIAFATLLLFLACSSTPRSAAPRGQDGPSLSDLDWMAGTWAAVVDGVTMEEHWMSPKGGLMVGMHRDVPPDGVRATFEYLRIEVREAGIFYVASPGGEGATPFRLTTCEEGLARFENPEHDFPQAIQYKLEGEALTASIEGADGEGPSWKWKRVKS